MLVLVSGVETILSLILTLGIESYMLSTGDISDVFLSHFVLCCCYWCGDFAVLDLDWPDIADVTNFVHPGTPLDEEASQRATSVYLVGQRIDMLPKPLTEGIVFIYMACTLNSWLLNQLRRSIALNLIILTLMLICINTSHSLFFQILLFSRCLLSSCWCWEAGILRHLGESNCVFVMSICLMYEDI